MQSFPSSSKYDGRAAFNRPNNIQTNKKEVIHTYAPKYAQLQSTHNLIDQSFSNGSSQINNTSLPSNDDIEYEQSHQQSHYKQIENLDGNDFHNQLSVNNKIKGPKRRANSATSYANSYNKNSNQNEDGPNHQMQMDDNNDSSDQRVLIEKHTIKQKKIKKEGEIDKSSPSDPNNIYAALPEQLAKAQEKKKEEPKTLSPSKSFDYDHLNNRELYNNGPNMEKFFTRLSKKSRKDAVLQRSILARYSQNQVEYVGINKERKKSLLSEKLSKAAQYNTDSFSSNEKSNNDISNAKIQNEDTYEFEFDSAGSASLNSSRDTQQSQENTIKSKQIPFKKEDKFSHLNCRLTSLINYNDLAKAQPKYTKKVKDLNKSNKLIKKEEESNDSEPTVIPPRLFFTRTPLFDDPENPKQREAQRIITSQTLPRPIPKEQVSSSRTYHNDSIMKNDYQNKNKIMNDFTPHTLFNKQNLGPTPQSKAKILGSYSIPSSPHQRRAISNLSIVSPPIICSTPHSQISGRKNRPSSLSSKHSKENNDLFNKKLSKPPIIPNSKLNSTSKSTASTYSDISNIIDDNNDSTNSSNSNINVPIVTGSSDQSNQPNNNTNRIPPIPMARPRKKIPNSQFSRNSLKPISSKGKDDDPLFGNEFDPSVNDENLLAKPRVRVSRRHSSIHRSLIIGENANMIPDLIKLQHLSDNTSPPTSNSSALSTNRSQNVSAPGVFKINPILPKKKQPKEEKVEEIEEIDKNKPIDSISFQMAALEKFKKEKKRKNLEKKGIYYFKKEKKQNKEDENNQSNKEGQLNGENENNQNNESIEEDEGQNNNDENKENQNDEDNEEHSEIPRKASILISNEFENEDKTSTNDIDENEDVDFDDNENEDEEIKELSESSDK